MSSPLPFAIDRILVERDRLTAAAAIMDQIVPDVSPFGEQTKTRLSGSLNKVRGDWDNLRKQIDDEAEVGTNRLEKLSDLSKATDRVAGEISALANGVLVREKNLDGGACAQADRLIAELAAGVNPLLARVTIPGNTEFLHRGSDLIRRRLPDHGLWDLPVMAHEFGHLVVSHKTWDPEHDQKLEVRSRVVTGWPDCSEGLGEEHFCDVYATYALGPAFAATLLLHRLNPRSPASNGESHPGDPRRAAVVLTALRRLSAGAPSYDRYRLLSEQLDAAWRSLRESAPDTAMIDGMTQSELDVRTKDVLTLLEAEFASARYCWQANTVRDVADALEDGRDPDGLVYEIRDVLAAAWMLRVEAVTSGSAVSGSVCTRADILIERVAFRPGERHLGD